MFCTADKVTKNTGRTVEVMETNRWHEDSSNFSGTWIKTTKYGLEAQSCLNLTHILSQVSRKSQLLSIDQFLISYSKMEAQIIKFLTDKPKWQKGQNKSPLKMWIL